MVTSDSSQGPDPREVVLANLPGVQALEQFLGTVGALSPADRRVIVQQALAMIEQLYVHLSLKKAIHAIDPVQRLKLLDFQLPALPTERAFHNEMISIYTHLRDLHTNYFLPAPYNTRTAALPFLIEDYFDAGARKYVVTQVSALSTDPNFVRGVTPTHWNGTPINLAVENNGEREAGSNLAARHAQGLASLTIRWMAMSLPPDEEWVVIDYIDLSGQARQARFNWLVFPPGVPADGLDPLAATGDVAARLGVDAKAEAQRRVRKLLFSPEAVALERQMARARSQFPAANAPAGAGQTPHALAAAEGLDSTVTSFLPDIFSSFRPVTTTSGTFAYIRLRSFLVNDEFFLREFIRIVSLLPQDGLILDVRQNGGGNIWAGERLLQLLTPGPIEPEPFSFVSSSLTLSLCKLSAGLSEWADSIADSVETGATFSRNFPLTPPELCNDVGQVYQGPVVIVIDAQCYSTTDIFSAGFQDHNIGKVLGTADHTGAGGANVWTHDDLRSALQGAPSSPFRPIPGGASFRVALRRSMRVGDRSGVLLEELGVAPDEVHPMTKADVLNGNVDLIEHAGRMLAAMGPPCRLSASVVPAPAAAGAPQTRIAATTKNLDRVDVFVSDRPRLTLDVEDGTRLIQLPPSAAPVPVVLNGYRRGRLMVSTRLTASPPPLSPTPVAPPGPPVVAAGP
jgi:hypothetical protein